MDDAKYLADAIALFRTMKRRADGAIAQIDDAQFAHRIDPESNSVGLIVKHIAGNMRSRWTDFLTTDGEKPDRERDSEFEAGGADTRAALMHRWEAGWSVFFATLTSLRPEDLSRTVRIRGEPLGVVDAIERQKEHYAFHVGQIVFLAKHLAGPRWKTMSIARGRSKDFENAHRAKHEGGARG